jgi:hypothetical protein
MGIQNVRNQKLNKYHITMYVDGRKSDMRETTLRTVPTAKPGNVRNQKLNEYHITSPQFSIQTG